MNEEEAGARLIWLVDVQGIGQERELPGRGHSEDVFMLFLLVC